MSLVTNADVKNRQLVGRKFSIWTLELTLPISVRKHGDYYAVAPGGFSICSETEAENPDKNARAGRPGNAGKHMHAYRLLVFV